MTCWHLESGISLTFWPRATPEIMAARSQTLRDRQIGMVISSRVQRVDGC